jgi:cell division protease FtsH
MAGRVAEEIIFGAEKVTSGASSDIKMATSMAQAMVTEWGLSEVVGPIFHGRSNEDMYASGAGDKTRSEKTSEAIDAEIKKIIDEGYNFAKNILTTHLDQLHILAKALIEKETLSGRQIKHLLLGNPIDSEEEPEFPFTGKKKPVIVKIKNTDEKVVKPKAKKSKKITLEDKSK